MAKEMSLPHQTVLIEDGIIKKTGNAIEAGKEADIILLDKSPLEETQD